MGVFISGARPQCCVVVVIGGGAAAGVVVCWFFSLPLLHIVKLTRQYGNCPYFHSQSLPQDHLFVTVSEPTL